MRNTARLAAFAALLLLHPCSVRAQQPNPSPILSLGNAVVTAFSGTVAPDPRRVPRTKSAIDLTFINPDAAAARIFDVRAPGFAWDARNWPAPKTFDVFARDTGQVFGIALDDEPSANIYLTATSAYGLQIVVPGANNTLERVTKGQQQATWMNGQFGLALGGGPGSIWKVDGRTGQVSLFANVTLNGASNAGPGLGNIAYDRAHRQLFASDLSTGMIHRFDLTGRELQTYDHGVAGRPTRNLPPVAFDPSRRVEITDSRFDSENPDTWGFAAPERRVFAVAIHKDGRLYYSVWDGPQIWSVGIQPDGSLGNDPRWELDVAATPRSFPVSDMVFSDQGAMILAQRGGIVSSYDYSVFARPGEARVLRYTLEQPDDPATPSRWVAQPEEYAVGFRGDFRNTVGGVDLGYGWRDGRIDTGSCATTLWTTGESLRDNPAYATRLLPGGPFVVHGLQASPADQVRERNAPPFTAYFVDYDSRYDDARASGHIGSVRILRTDCVSPVAGGPGVTPPPSPPPVGPPPVCPQGLNPDGTCGVVPIDLAIKKTASEGKYDPAAGTWTFTFTLSVTNVGNPFTPANHIVINDPVPNGLTFTAAAGPNWTCPPGQFPATSPNALNCTYNFGPGQIATGAALAPLVITITVKNAGKYENCATTRISVAPWLQETTLQNNRDCAPIVVPVDLALKKTAGEAKYDPATGTWTFQYTLTVTNVGAAISPASPNVIAVSDPIPAGLTFTSATGPSWNCNAPPALSAGTLTCAYTGAGTIAHNQTLGAITITVTTKTPEKYENCATVGVTAASGQQETTLANNKDCVPITIIRPVVDLAIKKTVGDVKYDKATGIWTFQYTLDVTNAGNPFAPQNYIAINDPVPSGLTFQAASGGNWNCPIGQFPVTTALNCSYNFGTGVFTNGAHLNPLVITVTTKTPGKYENCATVGIAPASGFQETTLANNKDCVPIEIKTNGGFDTVKHYPEIKPTCGINVIFVVDVSGSIAGAGATSQVQTALNNAKQSFNNVNSSGVQAQGAVITFSDSATVLQPMSAATLTTAATLTFGGETNWEAAMQLASQQAALAPTPLIIVFITDGIPNRIVSSPNTVDSVTATNAAIPFVNSIYASHVPILGIGLFDADPVNGPIHLHALLGGNDQATSFGGLNGQLQSFAKNMCPDLYLSKGINPNAINYHYSPDPQQVTVTLTLQNTNGALTNAVVQDALPPELTNPTSPNPPATIAGNVVTWNLPAVAANATVTLTFNADVIKPTTFPACPGSHIVRNFAQVTAVTPPVHSTPNNMANPVTGPVHEHDEASAGLWLQDCGPTSSSPSLLVTKSSMESCLPAGQQTGVATAAGPCTFTVKVQAVGNFVGNVAFGDAVFTSPGGTPVASALSSITAVISNPNAPLPSGFCPLTFTTTAASCTQNNMTLSNGQTITLTFTLAAPPNLAPGNYKNCFMAAQDTLPAAQKGLPYYNANSPVSQWYSWGDCGVFTVPAMPALKVIPPQVASPPPPQCDPQTTIKRGNICVCRIPGMVKSSETACACPTGMNFVPGRGCVRPIVCLPPMIPNPTNTACICPPETVARGRECVKQTVCTPPMIPAPGGGRPGAQSCVCPPPMVPGPASTTGATPNFAGAQSCVCPQGTVQQGRECVKQPACQPPMVPAPTGGRAGGAQNCVCPQGTVQRGRECVKQPACQPPMVPAPTTGNYTAGAPSCVCPQGTVQQGRDCVRPGPTRPQSNQPPRGGPATPGAGPATPGTGSPYEPPRGPVR